MAKSPSLDATDRLSLTHCTVVDHELVDQLTGDRHSLNASAAALLRHCDGRQTVRALCLDVANGNHADADRVQSDLSAFVAVLERAGLARVRRRWRTRLHPAALLGGGARGSLPAQTPRHRYPPTVGGCVRAAARSGVALLLAAGAATLMALVAIGRLATGVPLTAALVPVLVVVASLATVAGHEVGHLLAVRGLGGRAAFVASTANQVAVAHDIADPTRRRRVALAGPLTGAGLALVAWPALTVLPAVVDGLIRPAAVLLALGHLASLLPWFADGRAVWRSQP